MFVRILGEDVWLSRRERIETLRVPGFSDSTF